MAEYDKNWMIKDILEANNIESEDIKYMLRTAYFRGLAHSGDKERIIREAQINDIDSIYIN